MSKISLVWIIVLAGTCLMLTISVVGCAHEPDPYRPGSAQNGFPPTDIVYVTLGLGFINADGSGATSLPFWIRYTDFVSTWQSPLMTSDRKIIFVTYTAAPGYYGKIFAVQAGQETVVCGWDGVIQIAADGSYILVDIGGTIHKYLPSDCGTGNPPEKVYSGVSGALSPDEQYVAYAREEAMGVSEPNLIFRHIATGEESIVGVGNFPVWSRDGEWLAYTGPDGIYILPGSPNTEPRRLVPLESSNPDDLPVYQAQKPGQYYPPIASWSPDGKWLVYHVFSNNLVDADAEDMTKSLSVKCH
ncbi:MAG: PD40 domain-containing protein [Anaerolineales bacterium]|nr:PD40 domain-containing protein [Anaerolineales bacterium]